MIALHGNLGSYRDWDFLEAEDLQAIDLWEHTAESFAEFSDMLQQTTPSGSILLGYSLGGRLALHAMAANPDHWAGAVIISAHPGLCCLQERIERRISDEIWAKYAREMEWAEFLAKWNAQPVLGDTPDNSKQIELEVHREKIAQAFENWTLGKQENLNSGLERFKNPVLWITGEQDQKFTQLGGKMTELFPDFQHEIIPNCGHRVMIDAPDRLAEEVAWFSKQIGSD